jgi:hypothetical protein
VPGVWHPRSPHCRRVHILRGSARVALRGGRGLQRQGQDFRMGGVLALCECRGRMLGRRRCLPPRPGSGELAGVEFDDVLALLGQPLRPARLALHPLQPKLWDRCRGNGVGLLHKRARPARDGGRRSRHVENSGQTSSLRVRECGRGAPPLKCHERKNRDTRCADFP